jgi:hypothetical protein
MAFIDWAAAILGALLSSAAPGRSATGWRRFRNATPATAPCVSAGYGWPFPCAAVFDIEPLKRLFRLFLEAAD